jgi:O-antigen/teichoic acid export membrane protein
LNYKKRFLVSFIANFFKAGLGAVTSFIIARQLGPDETGRMFFLLFSFASFKGLFDLGTSSAFFTFLSKENQSVRFINIFFCWVFIQFITVFVFVAFLIPENYFNLIWVNEDRFTVILAFVASFMLNSVWTITSQMAEAARKTLQVQLIAVLFTGLHVLVIIFLIYFDKLGIHVLFFAITLEWFFAGYFSFKLYKPTKFHNQQSLYEIFQIYKDFCLPLVPSILLSVIYNYADRWMLQNWSGSSEQAYFGIALKVSSIALLATSSLTKIFWKESALLAREGKFDELLSLYKKCSSFLLSVSIFFVAVVHPFTEELIFFTLGASYLGGVETMIVLLFYPIYQSLGQLLGSLMYALEKTVAYSIISSVFMLVSIIVTYVLLAPKTFLIPGLNLGSLGLSLKIVLLSILSVNVLYFYICKVLGWPFMVKNQLLPLILVPIFYLLKYFISFLINSAFLQVLFYLSFVSILIGCIVVIYKKDILKIYNEL